MVIFFETKEQPLEVFYKRSCSQKFRNIHRKTPVLESLFNNAGARQTCNILKKDSNTSVFLWILQILKNFCERLLLGIMWYSNW